MFKKIWKTLIAVSIVLLFVLIPATPAAAAEIRGYENVIIASGDVVDDDLYLAGNRIVINGTVNGDVLAAGSTIIIGGTVNGDLTALGSTVTIDGEVTGSVRVAASSVNIGGTIGEDLVAAGSSITIDEASEIGRDLVFGASDLRVNSTVGGDIQGISELVEITNSIDGNAEIEVSRLVITSTARIGGNLVYTSNNEANIHSEAVIGGEITRHFPVDDKWDHSRFYFPVINTWMKVLSYLAALLVGIILVLVTPRKSVEVVSAIRNKPLASLGWGALILFVTPIAILITILTVIGIPIGLITILLYAFLVFVSQLVIGLFIGHWILSRFSVTETRGSLTGALCIGFTILTLVKLIPVVGWVAGFATALFGIGAIGVLVFKKRQKQIPATVEVIDTTQP